MNLPDWLKNLLVLIAVVVVLWIIWGIVKAVLTVVIWAVALGLVGFGLKWLWDKLVF
jgi:hypothetical protein